MLSLSAAALIEKNQLDSTGAWLVLLELDLPDASTIRLARDTADVTWNGNTYQRFPFELDDYTESSKNELPSLSVRVGNVSRAIEQYMETYDGMVGCACRILVVHSDHLDLTEPEVQLAFQVTGSSADAQWATFQLGASNPFMLRCPRRRILRNHCAWKFKSTDCGYAGSAITCNKTLDRCRELANSGRFGGFPRAGRGGDYA